MSFQYNVTFKNGQKMPLIGYGTWSPTEGCPIEGCVDQALQAGYRHIDTAYVYRNEDGIGTAMKKWFDSGKLKREDVFVTTKLPMIGMRPDLVPHFLKLSLKKLELDYVDLYLVHAPVGLKYESDTDYFPVDAEGTIKLDVDTDLEKVWQAMEAQVKSGLAKSIGLSNFNVSQIERIMKIATIPPANLQLELHVYCQQKKLREICAKHNITICAYAPLGSTGRVGIKRYENQVIYRLLEDPLVKEIAKKYKKSEAQVLLRFLVQQDIVVIPKSGNTERIQENIKIFDFVLDTSDMEKLSALDKGKAGRTFSFTLFKGVDRHPECVVNYDG